MLDHSLDRSAPISLTPWLQPGRTGQRRGSGRFNGFVWARQTDETVPTKTNRKPWRIFLLSPFPPVKIPGQRKMMKNRLLILLTSSVLSLHAADMPQTNSPAAGSNAPPAANSPGPVIPDATHKPVFTTNVVTIAGKP